MAIADSEPLIVGEVSRTIDDRYRLALPPELAAAVSDENGESLLAKERLGCLSLWAPTQWEHKLQEGMDLVRGKIRAGRLDGRVGEVQALGRLLSTRQRRVTLAGRSRLVIPEGFREFLGVEPGGSVMIVGAAVCVEIWRPEAWTDFLGQQMPAFRELFDELTK